MKANIPFIKMKKFIVLALTTSLLIGGLSVADIQSPPGGKQTPIRKLSRAVGNILFGINEIPTTWSKTLKSEGSIYASSYGVINGTYRSLVRAGYGIFEFVTFPVETYKGSHRPDYGGKNIWWDLNHGYSELAPELGFQTKFDTGRTQSW